MRVMKWEQSGLSITVYAGSSIKVGGKREEQQSILRESKEDREVQRLLLTRRIGPGCDMTKRGIPCTGTGHGQKKGVSLLVKRAAQGIHNLQPGAPQKMRTN